MAGAQGGVGVHGWANFMGDPSVQQIKDALNSAHQLIIMLRKDVEQLKSKGQKDDHKKDLKEMKSFGQVPVWDGSLKSFSDFEFKLHQFVDPFARFEEFLDHVKNLDEPPSEHDINVLAAQQLVNGVDIHWMNAQLYSVLSMKTSDDPLQLVKSVRDSPTIRGVVAWHKMTREVSSKTGVCLERLSDRVHHPKKITEYKDALVMLHKWDADCKELKKLAQQELAELTKRATLKAMIPEDLKRDIEKDESLKPFDKSWGFVLKQVPLRKEWKQKKRSNDMDIGLAERTEDPAEEGDQDAMQCKPCEDELYTLKGQGKGASSAPFQGYCSWCWAWGHKRFDCRKRLAAEAAGKGADPNGGPKSAGKGEEKGKNTWKGAQKGGVQKGGWQYKGGGKGQQKGQQKGKGNWGGGFALNIDGGDPWGSHGEGAWGQGSWQQGYDGGYNGLLWLFEECSSDGSGSSAGDLDDLLVLEEAEDLAVPAGETSEELISPMTDHSYESDLLPIHPKTYSNRAELPKFETSEMPDFKSYDECYAYFASSAPSALTPENSNHPESATPEELRASNASFYPISTPEKKKKKNMSPMTEHLNEMIYNFDLPHVVGGADERKALTLEVADDSEYECPVPDADSISPQDVAAGMPDPELVVDVYCNYSHTSNQNSLSAMSAANAPQDYWFDYLGPQGARRDPLLDFASTIGEPEAKISYELQPLSMSMDERESIRIAEDDLKNGLFPDLADSESEPEDEREYRDAERRKSSRKHGPRRPPPAPESYLMDYPPVVPKTKTFEIGLNKM